QVPKGRLPSTVKVLRAWGSSRNWVRTFSPRAKSRPGTSCKYGLLLVEPWLFWPKRVCPSAVAEGKATTMSHPIVLPPVLFLTKMGLELCPERRAGWFRFQPDGEHSVPPSPAF